MKESLLLAGWRYVYKTKNNCILTKEILKELGSHIEKNSSGIKNIGRVNSETAANLEKEIGIDFTEDALVPFDMVKDRFRTELRTQFIGTEPFRLNNRVKKQLEEERNENGAIGFGVITETNEVKILHDDADIKVFFDAEYEKLKTIKLIEPCGNLMSTSIHNKNFMWSAEALLGADKFIYNKERTMVFSVQQLVAMMVLSIQKVSFFISDVDMFEHEAFGLEPTKNEVLLFSLNGYTCNKSGQISHIDKINTLVVENSGVKLRSIDQNLLAINSKGVEDDGTITLIDPAFNLKMNYAKYVGEELLSSVVKNNNLNVMSNKMSYLQWLTFISSDDDEVDCLSDMNDENSFLKLHDRVSSKRPADVMVQILNSPSLSKWEKTDSAAGDGRFLPGMIAALKKYKKEKGGYKLSLSVQSDEETHNKTLVGKLDNQDAKYGDFEIFISNADINSVFILNEDTAFNLMHYKMEADKYFSFVEYMEEECKKMYKV